MTRRVYAAGFAACLLVARPCALALAQGSGAHLAPATGARTLPANMVAAIDALYASYARPGSPGCAVAVYQHGAVVFAKGYGLANLVHGVPITAQTRFTTGSVSKQFTAASIALLALAGRLSLEDDVRKFVPELATFGSPIRIRHLVHHTSGLRDFWELVDLAGMRPDDGYTVSDILELVSRQRALNFEPGAEYRYSNTGYLLLGVVVQRITGQSLRQFADSAIFSPLGMKQTLFLDDHNEIVSGRAMAYSPKGKDWRVNVWNNDLVGQGGIVTTLSDLQKWDENFYAAKVGGPAFVALQQRVEPLLGGGANPYAFGLDITSYRGVRLVEHTGATGGYRSALFRFPDQHASMAMMCNVSNANTTTLALRMADIVLKDALGAEQPANSLVADASVPKARTDSANTPRPARDLSALHGRYTSNELMDAVWVVAPGNTASELKVSRPRHAFVVARYTGAPNTFASADSSLVLRFDDATAAPAPGFTLDGSRVNGIRFVRAPQ